MVASPTPTPPPPPLPVPPPLLTPMLVRPPGPALRNASRLVVLVLLVLVLVLLLVLHLLPPALQVCLHGLQAGPPLLLAHAEVHICDVRLRDESPAGL